jgi:peptidase A4-like protein
MAASGVTEPKAATSTKHPCSGKVVVCQFQPRIRDGGFARDLIGCRWAQYAWPVRARWSWALLGVATAVFTAACGSSSPARAPHFESIRSPAFGPFAGYVWPDPVDSIGASWRVPAIGVHSHAGLASTWVGTADQAQSPIVTGIQVGIDETRKSARHGRVDHYSAFWSDTDRGFHPVALFNVRPGDAVHAELTLQARRWKVSIQDLTSHAVVQFTTGQEANSTFNTGYFLQEDVTNGRNGKVLPYPTIAGTRFFDLTINGYSPFPSALLSEWMSTGHGDLGPTQIRAGSFVIHNVTPTLPGLRFLRLAQIENAATSQFYRELARWPRLNKQKRIGASSAFDEALTRATTLLTQSRWPSSASALIRQLIEASDALRVDALTLTHLAPNQLDVWKLESVQSADQFASDVYQIRQVLDVPEYTLNSH